MEKKLQVFALLALVLAALALVGCTAPVPPTPNPVSLVDDSNATVTGVADTVNQNNEFAFDFFNRYGGSSANEFISPWSISSALAMTYEGAKGETAAQMKNVLKFGDDSAAMRSSFARLYNVINKPDKNYLLSTVNALWAEQDFNFLPDYFSRIEKYYGGKVTNMDFKTDAENSRIIINKWVEGKTNSKIKDLIAKGLIKSDTRLVLTNAIYFKGKWQDEFKAESTREEDFVVGSTIACTPCVSGVPCEPCPTDGGPVKVQMMHRTGEMLYMEDGNMQAIQLPYKNNELSMVVMLPKNEQNNLLPLLQQDPSYYNAILSQMSSEEVNLALPKFKFESEYELSDALTKEGMPIAFSDDADFSGMTGELNLKISKVVHKSFVEVNEEGTEAAAATAVIMQELTGMPKPLILFNANHPFVFIIKENSTEQILFIGTMKDPSKAQ